MIPWNNPRFGDKEIELVRDVLESGYVSEGTMTKELEKRLSEICHAKHIIMTTSATAALYLAIEADKRIRNYTEGMVMIPNLTFIATKNAVEQANLTPKILDVDDTYGLKRTITTSMDKIIIPVNLLGRENKWNFDQQYIEQTLIFDNAGCLGSNVPNGKVGCYSLQANKLLTCGQGGFCATDDDEYAKVIRQLKDFGRENKEDQHTKGFNFKFNDIQAAVALGQLEQLRERKLLHIDQWSYYKKELSKFGQFIQYDPQLIVEQIGETKYKIINAEGEIPLWVEFITDKRDELFEYLKENGVEARKPWKPLVYNPELYPNTDYYTKNCLWLPNGASLSDEDQTKVISLIKKFYEDRK